MKNRNRFTEKAKRFFNSFEKRKGKKFPSADNPESIQRTATGRRELIKNLAVFPLLGVPFFNIIKKSGWTSYAEDNLGRINEISGSDYPGGSGTDISNLQESVPKGKIKHVEISRIIPGGNLVAGFVYSRDLLYVSALMKTYFTDDKVIEILSLCEDCGINTTIMRTDDQTLRILKEHWRRGGKIQWIAQTYPNDDDLSNIKIAVDNGAVGAFPQGGIADKYVKGKRLDYLAKAIDFIRSQGLIGGTAGHMLEVPKACIQNGIKPDFFMKTFHHHNYWSAPSPDRHDRGYSWCDTPEEVASYFSTCNVPWIAYKVLAAGAIKPSDGFKYAFQNGADFVCVGMFDFQVVENANATTASVNSSQNRNRGWYA